MEESLLKNTNCVFYAAFPFGLANLGREDNGVVVLCPCGIILIQIWIDPILIGSYSLLAI